MNLTGTPYEEQDQEEEALYHALSHIHCPHCQEPKDRIIDTWFEEMPPRQDTLVVHWTCEKCDGFFITHHQLVADDCGEYRISKPL
jgi:hypothetical protein